MCSSKERTLRLSAMSCTAARKSTAVQGAIAAAIANTSDVARYYLASRVESWGGEVVTSVFVHVSLQGSTLYLEFSIFALLPTRAEYHIVDEEGRTGADAAVKAAVKGLFSLPEEMLAIRRVARAPGQLWAAVRPRPDQTSKARASINIGTAVSAREGASADADGSYFQFQDILQHSKIIERRLIAAVEDYLKGLGVDTSEFSARVQAVLNQGVINAGPGTINISDSAIGENATVTGGATPPET
jgi:hypothetical protein